MIALKYKLLHGLKTKFWISSENEKSYETELRKYYDLLIL